MTISKRFKGFNLDNFLDGKIAEEESNQKKPAGSNPAKRSPSNVRRGSARTESPRRANSRLRVPDAGNAASNGGSSPDPEDFVIGDDASDISRAATPTPSKEMAEGPLDQKAGKDDAPSQEAGKGNGNKADEELPKDVQQKLRKLDNLSAKYQGRHYPSCAQLLNCCTHHLVCA